MVNVRQLELNLEVAFEEAAEVPETADVLSLWKQFEGELAGLEQRDHRLCIESEKFWPLRLNRLIAKGFTA